LNNFRIDSLAFDTESRAFIIVEYKRNKNFSVIDQGYAYLSLMLNNKADFILEYNECCKETLKRNNVDWSQSKIIFISQSFTTYQKEAVNFKDLPIELWEVRRFRNNTISFNKYDTAKSKESIKTISRTDETVESVSKEIEVFTEDNHIAKASDEIEQLYSKLKSSILNLNDDIEINPRKHFVGFKCNGKTFSDVVIQKKGLKLFINLKSGELKDSLGLSRDVSNVGHWGNGAYEIQFNTDDQLEYIVSLIKQSLIKNSKEQ
jgi:predicted transport protein